jgi:DNA-binding PadR family transcriptional regulator
MLVKGWMTGDWGPTDENRRARYYRLTPAGRRQLAREIDGYRQASTAIGLILNPA